MNSDFGKLILRIAVGGLMIFHGVHKVIYGHDFIVNQLEKHGLPSFLYIGVPIGEILAPLLLLVGVFTRISAAIIALTMLMSIYLVKGISGFDIDPNTGGLAAELNILYMLVALAIVWIGPGKLSLLNTRMVYLQ